MVISVKFTFFVVPVFFIVLFTSCVTAPVKMQESTGTEESKRLEIVQYAQSLLGRKDLSQINGWFRNDCSGYILGVYHSLGYHVVLLQNPPTDKISLALYHSLNKNHLTYNSGVPNRADLVFFKGTIDESRDEISHVGIVADVLNNGTVFILNYTSRGVTALRMNLITPSIHKDEYGTVKNDYLKKKSSFSKSEKLLSGELFFCFGDLFKYAAL